MVKIIHQTWKDAYEIPEFFKQEWRDSWLKQNKDWQVIVWNDSGIEFYIRHYYPDYFPIWQAYPKQIMRVDAWRYLLLKNEGGLYVDMDFACLYPLESWLPQGSKVIVGDQGDGKIGNAFMYAPQPQMPFFDDIEEELIKAKDKVLVIETTGPNFFTSYFGDNQTNATVLDSRKVYPLAWNQTSKLEEAREKSLDEIKKEYPSAKAITFWENSWQRK